MIRSRIVRVVAATSLIGAGFGIAASTSGADQTLVACSGVTAAAKLNPTLKSGDAKYIKSAGLGTTGTCLVDEGIANDQSTQDVKYVLDDQSANNNVLTMLKDTSVLSGSVSCNSTDTSLLTDYPAAYPIQGKVIWKFNETFPTLVNIQIQQYLRGGRDPLDTNPANFTLSGIVIKGPGVGGNVSATLQFFPNLLDPKNLNIADCVANPATRNAVLASLGITQSDGSDAGTAVDVWSITIPT